MERNKALVISLDALTTKDLEELRKRTNTKELLSSSSLVENIHIVFPSLTYPCHAAVVTGCYPDKSGIYHNEILSINEEKNPWFWWGHCHKRETIIDIANKAGLITAAVAWPTLAGETARYTIPEIWPIPSTEDTEKMYRDAVSREAWPVFEKNRHFLLDRTKPFYDLFASSSAVDIIKEKKPDLLLVHLSYLDHVKHKKGSERSLLRDAYDFLDEKIGEIVKALKDAGTYDDTTFFILGDHGQMDVKGAFSINRVLKDKGYITEKNGRIESYRIICHPSSFSSIVFLNGIDEEEAAGVFKEIKREYPGTIERIMTKFEAEKLYHLSGPFSLVLESRENLIFSYSPDLPVLMDREECDRAGLSYSTHGYAPERGEKPPFAVCGKRAQKGRRIKWAALVDEAPTILSLFSLRGDDMDGKVIRGLLG